MDIKRYHNRLEITYRWIGWGLLYNAMFTVAWNYIVLSAFASITITEIIPALILFPFVIVGVGLIYYSFINMFNKTTVMLNKDMLKIQHEPTLSTGNKILKSNDIKQLFTQPRYGKSGRRRACYDIHAYLNDNQSVILINSLTKRENALLIEKEIESFLNIKCKDKPILWAGYGDLEMSDIDAFMEKGTSLTMRDVYDIKCTSSDLI